MAGENGNGERRVSWLRSDEFAVVARVCAVAAVVIGLLASITLGLAGYAFWSFDKKVEEAVSLGQKANQTLATLLGSQSGVIKRQDWLEKDLERHDRRITELERVRSPAFPPPRAQ